MTKYSDKTLIESTGPNIYNEAKKLIPGGTQLLSKRPEMFAPNLWPSYYKKAKGYHIWDLDNKKFIDMSIMGVGAAILGYANKFVDNSVIKQLKYGVQTTLNSKKEYDLAQKLVDLHPWFDSARFARSGGEAMTLAVRIARATTNRNKILFNGYHGWFDWYLSSNIADSNALDQHLMEGLSPVGVDTSLISTSSSFTNNEIDILESKFNMSEVAAIIIEPARGVQVSSNILEKLRNICDKNGIVLIFDEITSGFREEVGGIHKRMKVKPDMAVFAKSMGNGYAISCVIGTKAVMTNAENSFISSTNWTECIGPTAALSTIDILESTNAHETINKNGLKIKKIWENIFINEFKLSAKISGVNSLPVFNLNIDGINQLELETFLTIELLKYGILGFKQFKPSTVHNNEAFNYYENSLYSIIHDLVKKDFNFKLNSPVRHSGFQRLTKE